MLPTKSGKNEKCGCTDGARYCQTPSRRPDSAKPRSSSFWDATSTERRCQALPRNRHQRRDGRGNVAHYNWKAKYGGLSASDLKRLKDLEAENARLKKMYADLSLVHDALKDAIEKKL